MAAPIAGLPEQVGGERNWDYRYTWVRDASFSVYALLRLGFTEEAAQFSGWLRDRVAEREGEALQLAPPLRFRSLPGALRVRTGTSRSDTPAG